MNSKYSCPTFTVIASSSLTFLGFDLSAFIITVGLVSVVTSIIVITTAVIVSVNSIGFVFVVLG